MHSTSQKFKVPLELETQERDKSLANLDASIKTAFLAAFFFSFSKNFSANEVFNLYFLKHL